MTDAVKPPEKMDRILFFGKKLGGKNWGQGKKLGTHHIGYWLGKLGKHGGLQKSPSLRYELAILQPFLHRWLAKRASALHSKIEAASNGENWGHTILVIGLANWESMADFRKARKKSVRFTQQNRSGQQNRIALIWKQLANVGNQGNQDGGTEQPIKKKKSGKTGDTPYWFLPKGYWLGKLGKHGGLQKSSQKERPLYTAGPKTGDTPEWH